ncbi:MAG: MMPL family transporter [Porticoccaceae bacterium]|jgi:predicted RND superfamily exporter protein|nr:MMPL family transporter [Alphaproteobacteria bacterium]MDP4743633.1 MMPL family transporter [Porticoccaceae bacterium]MDP4753450.1 MMPL family transporter [Porticoccaceae bacterium]
MSSALFDLYQKTVLRRPLRAILMVVALTVGMAFGLPNFKLDASADSLTLEHDDDLNFFREVIQRYGSDNFLIVTFSPKQGDLFDDENLQLLASLRDELATIKGVESMLSLLDVPLLYSPKISVADLQEDLNTLLSPGVDRQLARQEFLNSPIYKNLILSGDGQTTGMLATLELDQQYLDLVRARDALRLTKATKGLTAEEQIELDSVSQEFLDYRTAKAAQTHQMISDVRTLMDGYRDRATIFLGGPDMITADMVDFIKSDLVIFGAGILIFIIATLAIIFRKLRWVVLPLATCALCLVIILGFLSWIDWRLTVISSNFVSLLLIITLALTMHLIVRYREIFREQPDASQDTLVIETVKSMVKPCLYTVLTTMVAFLSLVVSNIRPVIDFGWMMTLGISLALVVAFIIIPAGMMLIGKGNDASGDDNSAAFTSVFAVFTERHGNLVLLIAGALGILSIYGTTQLQVENRFIDYFRSDTEIYQGMEIIDSSLGGTTPLDIILQAPTFKPVLESSNDQPMVDSEYGDDAFADDAFAEDAFAEATPTEQSDYTDDAFGDDAFGDSDSAADPFGEDASTALKDTYWFTSTGLADLAKLQRFIEAQPEVGKVSSLVQIYDVASDLSGHKLNDFEIAFMRKSFSPDIYRQMVAPYLIEDLDETRIQLRAMETEGLLRRAELLEKIRDYAINEVGIAPENIRFTGLLVLYNNMLQSLYKSQILTLGAVFVGIMLMFMVLFRSVKISVIAILPNFLAAGIVLGGMGLAGIPLDMMTITIAAITVGIGVDHAIHYLTRFQREFVKDGNYVASMHRAHASIGLALFYTAVTIIAGFSILALSNFIPSIYFGLLTSLAMTAALLGSMTLLPKLILITKPLGPEAPKPASTLDNQ